MWLAMKYIWLIQDLMWKYRSDFGRVRVLKVCKRQNPFSILVTRLSDI